MYREVGEAGELKLRDLGGSDSVTDCESVKGGLWVGEGWTVGRWKVAAGLEVAEGYAPASTDVEGASALQKAGEGRPLR